MEILESHLKIFKVLEGMGYTIDVFGASYPCSNDKDFTAKLPAKYAGYGAVVLYL